ncbi:MAG: hypothetical protein M1832_004638 [Thelocarpon impressellum]|nr:MAG: hypothetical protein M1832_004638 [Thelocarpon impressellum]
MLQCLESFEGQDWEGKECGQRKWYKSGSMASRACYVACNTCMREAIDEGVTKVKCKPPASNLSSMCEMGFKKD